MEMLLIVLFHMLAVVSIKNNMKKILIKIIIALLLIYLMINLYEMIDCNNKVEVIEPIAIEEEHKSIHVDYSKVETEQRRQGTMVIIMN